jgi:hypothetical protein
MQQVSGTGREPVCYRCIRGYTLLLGASVKMVVSAKRKGAASYLGTVAVGRLSLKKGKLP